MAYSEDMTRAAVLHTEQPDLQALFDEDWASGKYRRPKCSKADYYAGWLVAYERFRTVMATEKVAIVEKPAKPARVAKTREIEYERYSEICHGTWVKACTGPGTSSDNTGHLDICQEDKPKLREMRGYRYENGHAMRNQCGEMRNGKHGSTQWIPAQDEHTKIVTHYQGALPLKRISPIKGMSPARNDHVCSGQAIPDSMIRKLAIMAGRPEIAP